MTPFRLLRLIGRTLVREGRAGELTVLAAALVVAVGSISAVGLLNDRIDQAMLAQAAELLGGDLVLSASAPIPAALQDQAIGVGLQATDTLSFRTMLVKGETLRLVEAKAVDAGYPLRGRLGVADVTYGEIRPTRAIPAPGTAWIATDLAAALDLKVADEVTLGEKVFSVAKILAYEPDRAGDLFSIAPRVLFHRSDVPATGLIQPGSRVRYRLLLAGARDQIKAFRTAFEAQREKPRRPNPNFAPNSGGAANGAAPIRIQGLADARPEMRSAIEQARRFLGLASLSAVILAGVAIAIAARRYVERHLDTAGLLRALGLRRSTTLTFFAGQLLMLGAVAGLVGLGLGYLGQAVLANLLGPLFVTTLPPPGWTAPLLGWGFGIVTLLGFGLPPLRALGEVSPLRVLRRDPAQVSGASIGWYAAAFVSVVIMMAIQVPSPQLLVYLLGGLGLGGLGLMLVALAMVRALQLLRNQVGVAWRFGLANIARRGTASAVQAVAFGLGLMALLLLAIVRGDLLEAWRANLAPDAPNYFAINIPPDESQAVAALLSGPPAAVPASEDVRAPAENPPVEGGSARPQTGAATYPMIRGRLLKINDRPVSSADYETPRAQRLVEREFNLSFAARPQRDNRIVAGQWWHDTQPDNSNDGKAFDPEQFSVETGLAAALGLQLGDTLTFDVAGTPVNGRISNLRAVQWESFSVNFFVVGTPALLQDFPATYVSSFHLPAARKTILNELVRAHPSVTVIDIDALLTKVRAIMTQATRGVEFVFLFTLLAGLCVLYAAIGSTLSERRYEGALLRTLGASRRRVGAGLAAEFIVLGTLAGALAAGGASAIGYLLATQVFHLPAQLNPLVWLVGVPFGAIVIGAGGLLGTRGVVTTPPMVSLREHA